MLLTMPRAIHTRPQCLLLVTVLLTWGCSSPERVAQAPAPPKPIPWDLALTPGTLATGANGMGPQLTASPNGAVMRARVMRKFMRRSWVFVSRPTYA